MNTDGGGWTLVWSYAFTNFNHFKAKSNAITHRPNWLVGPDYNDYNAINFSQWKKNLADIS